eukprot:CAMPEP_0175769542 /NCGR_PEP_ID=MMETSP0097-20121207/71013_1 /TAXON_ID=311494 /ORGANISM="Alexandrium monilatum, Strain CCMP3105" /LENGTH=106 /DNA_ID=CAMNT_0017079719 /DNA_START=33 /DNA_END=355 /DNA_ORIENTATION=-
MEAQLWGEEAPHAGGDEAGGRQSYEGCRVANWCVPTALTSGTPACPRRGVRAEGTWLKPYRLKGGRRAVPIPAGRPHPARQAAPLYVLGDSEEMKLEVAKAMGAAV